jgi:flagellum-specific ATP synthase
MPTATATDSFIRSLQDIPAEQQFGRVDSALGMMVEIAGAQNRLAVGDRCRIQLPQQRTIPVEVVGFRNGKALAMPFADLHGVPPGAKAVFENSAAVLYPHAGWLGRVINGMGEPVDGLGPLHKGPLPQPVKASPPPAHSRQRLGGKLDTGIRTINTFLTCCKGQRLGIFAGSGVGKSTLLSMLARYTAADITIIGLIGERGREVQEFLQEDLGPEGLARSIVVVATGDESPLMRRQAAWTTLAVAEYFRDQGRDVLCLMDSVTRFAMAQREIGLSAGEPPATKGYTPTVFAELPRLLERAGPGAVGSGTITGLFTVLVEGDDTNEPISDAVRGILDGHIILSRAIGERGRYPAIDVLRSVSRALPRCNSDDENRLIKQARRLLASYYDMEELIRLGAYKSGSNPEVDTAIRYYGALEEFLAQGIHEHMGLADGYQELTRILTPVFAQLQEGQ